LYWVKTQIRRTPELRQFDNAKKNGGLGTPVGQLLQPAAAAAGEHERQRSPRQSLSLGSARQHLRLHLGRGSAASAKTVRD
jgi:hypothetical protein